MNRIIAASAIAMATLTGAASAMAPDAELTEIRKFAPQADLSVLSDAEVLSLLNQIHSGDSNSEIRAYVNSVIENAS